jgi:hypothetical protein
MIVKDMENENQSVTFLLLILIGQKLVAFIVSRPKIACKL